MINIDSTTKARINDIEIIRNKIIHFHHEIYRDVIISLITHGIDIFVEFYRNYKYIKNGNNEPDKTINIDLELKAVKRYTSMRISTLKKKFIDFTYPRNQHLNECNKCYQEDTIVIKDRDNVMCIYCGNENKIMEMASFYSFYKGEIKTCPACKRESMAAVHMNENDEKAWDCIICGYYINRATNWARKNKFSWTGQVLESLII